MPLGIPHSVFLGWDPDDQDKALAWTRLRAQTCSRCGTRDDEWVWYDDHDRPHLIRAEPYDVEGFVCHGCEKLEKAQRDLPKESFGTGVRLVPLAPEPDD